MSVTESSCPCCAHVDATLQLSYMRCMFCGHRWRQGREPNCVMGYYESLTARNDLEAPWFTRKMRDRTELIAKLLEQMDAQRVLEVGCAEGALGCAVKARFDVVYDGIELSRDSVVARKRLDNLFGVPAEEVEAEPYSLIVSFHVLEHIADLGRELGSWLKLLREDGQILIEVPNQSGHSFLVEDQNIEHLHQFTPASLSMLLARKGFECISLSTGHYESPVYSDSIRVLVQPCTSMDRKHAQLVQRYKAIFNGAFLVYGVGGDFKNYLAPVISDLQVHALLDSSPQKWGEIMGGYVVERYDESQHATLPILVCSIRFATSIRQHLLSLGVAPQRIIGLESIYETT